MINVNSDDNDIKMDTNNNENTLENVDVVTVGNVGSVEMSKLIEMIDNQNIGRNTPHIRNTNFLNRFLETSDFDVHIAFLRVSKYVAWREEIGVGNISFEKIRAELETGKIYMPIGKLDREGNPIIIFVSRLHFPAISPTLLLVEVFTYILEVFLCDSVHYSGFTIINEMSGITMKNFDPKVFHFLQGLQQFCPVLPSQILLYHPSGLFSLLWRFVSPFLSETIKSRVKLVKNEVEFQKFLDPLPTDGGDLSWMIEIREKFEKLIL